MCTQYCTLTGVRKQVQYVCSRSISARGRCPVSFGTWRLRIPCSTGNIITNRRAPPRCHHIFRMVPVSPLATSVNTIQHSCGLKFVIRFFFFFCVSLFIHNQQHGYRQCPCTRANRSAPHRTARLLGGYIQYNNNVQHKMKDVYTAPWLRIFREKLISNENGISVRSYYTNVRANNRNGIQSKRVSC